MAQQEQQVAEGNARMTSQLQGFIKIGPQSEPLNYQAITMQNCLTLRIIFKSKKGNMWFHKSREFLQLFCIHHSHRPHHTPTCESDSVRQWTVRASLVQVFKFNFPTTAGVTDPPFCKCQLKKCIDSMFYLQVLIRFVQIRRFVFHSAKICC